VTESSIEASETAFERHLSAPRGRGPVPEGATVGSAGGGVCDDMVRFALRVADGRIADVTFDAEGCGATIAAASACIELVEGAPLLRAAHVGSGDIAAALGGLSPGKRHAAAVAADAFHRTLTNLLAGAVEPLISRSGSRVLVAMSGGVDSAVAALLARETDEEVIAVTLKLWSDPLTDGTKSCCSPQAVVSARALAHSMGLPHVTLDLRERFRDAVVADFLGEHDRGRTPNPCVRCNGFVRFDAMLQAADRLGAETLVTGHYARIVREPEGPLLARGLDPAKDQAYMLSALDPGSLERIRFPLGEMCKPAVRRLAREAALPVAEKKESQDLCFMAGTSRRQFLARHAAARDKEGEIVDRSGRVLGRHRGHRHYTVGQRRGLGVASGKPLFVLGKDAPRNRVVVGEFEELAVGKLEISPARLYRDGERVDRVRLRYRSEPVACRLERLRAGEHQTIAVHLEEPVHGIAPGQTACLLDGDLVVGHGKIATAP